jgi:hypothetical protein
MEWRVRDDVGRVPIACEEIVAGFAEATVEKIGADDPHPGAAERSRHRAVAAGAFPDVALEPFVFDERIRGPGRSGIEIEAIQTGGPLIGDPLWCDMR